MPDIWTLATTLAKFGLYLSILTSAGGILTAASFGLRGQKRGTSLFATIGLIAACVLFSLRGAMLTGDAGGLTDPEMLGLLWHTAAGSALITHMLGFALLLLGLVLPGRGHWLSVLGALMVLYSLAQVGHIGDRDSLFLTALLMMHLAAASFWIGILTPLSRLARDPAQHLAAAQLGHDFGRLASIAVPLLIIAGGVMTYRLVGSLPTMLNTEYGLLLLVKIALVAGLLAIAAHNKLRLIPEMRAGRTAAAKTLTKAITLEWAAILLILGITAILTTIVYPPT